MDLKIRKQFPLTEDCVYLNAAGACPQPLRVEEAARSYLHHHNREAPDDMGLHLDKLEVVRASVASLIGAQPGEIAFTMCTGDGSNMVANALELGPGDNVVMNDLDYPTNLLVWWDQAQRKGVDVRVIQSVGGAVTIGQYERAVDRNTRLIGVSHVSHANGYRENLRALADLAHAHGAYLLVDAIQSVGSIRVDVQELGVDFLSVACYKWLMGPRGLAFFYIREALLDRVRPTRQGWMQLEDGFYSLESRKVHTSARKFEYGMLNFLGVHQLGAALEFTEEIGREEIETQVLALSSRLYGGLEGLGLRLFTPAGNRSGVVSFYARNGVEIGDQLEKRRIVVTGRPGYVRIAPHFYNRPNEVDTLIEALSTMDVRL